MIRIVVADDQELVRAGFVMMLNHQPDLTVVGEAATGIAAVDLTRSLAPEIVLMDLRMPQMDGISATRLITGAPGATAKVLVLTTFDDDDSVYAALKAGASGFLLKDVQPKQLADAVRTVAAGQSLFAPTVTRRLIERFVSRQPANREMLRRVDLLSDREGEVLRWIARGMSNGDIAVRLSVSEATVKSHVSHLLAKLEARDRAQAVAFAYEAGFLRAGAGEQD